MGIVGGSSATELQADRRKTVVQVVLGFALGPQGWGRGTSAPNSASLQGTGNFPPPSAKIPLITSQQLQPHALPSCSVSFYSPGAQLSSYFLPQG